MEQKVISTKKPWIEEDTKDVLGLTAFLIGMAVLTIVGFIPYTIYKEIKSEKKGVLK